MCSKIFSILTVGNYDRLAGTLSYSSMQKLLFLSAEDFGFGPVSVLTQALATVSLSSNYQFVIEAGTNYESFLHKNNLKFVVEKKCIDILDNPACQGSIVCQNPIAALQSWKHDVPCIYLDNFFWFWELDLDRINSIYQKIKQLKYSSDHDFTHYLDTIAQQHPHDLYVLVHFFTQTSLIQYFGSVVRERLKQLADIAKISYQFYGATIAPTPTAKKQPKNIKPYIYTQLGGMLSPQTSQTYLTDYLTIVCGALNYLNRHQKFRIECKIPSHLLTQFQSQFTNITLLGTISFNEHINKIRQADYLFIQPGINSIFEAVHFAKQLFILPELNPSHSSNMLHLLASGFQCHHFCFYSAQPATNTPTDSSYLTTAIKKLLSQNYQRILVNKFNTLFTDKAEARKVSQRKKIITKLVKNFRGSEQAGTYITIFINNLSDRQNQPRTGRSVGSKICEHFKNHWLMYLVFASLNLLVRLPSFLEPVWYVDEALYILIGKQLATGSVLYRDIVDHKPPLVYLLAYLIPNQAGLRFLSYVLSTFGAVFFYQLIALLTPHLKKIQRQFYTAVFIVLMGIPAFEGYIFNAEPIYIPFVLAALVLFLKAKLPIAAADTDHICSLKKEQVARHYMVGLLLGLATFTKITALLYAVPIGMLLSGCFILQVVNKNPVKKWLPILYELFFLVLGISTPFLIGLLYFAAHHSVTDYLFWTFTYNFSDYLNHWEYFFSFPHRFIAILFSTHVKSALLGLALLLVSLGWVYKKITTHFFFAYSLALTTLYGVTLSNRPFPNYWLQFIPPALILVTFLMHTQQKRYLKLLIAGTFLIAGFIFKIIPFKPFPVIPYYQASWRYATGSINRQEYERYFNPLVDESLNPNSPDVMGDNQHVISELQNRHITTLYVWGTNPMIFVDAPLVLTTKFPLTFHLAELNALSVQIKQVKQQHLPAILVMKPYPYPEETEFYDYVNQKYAVVYDGSAMTLFVRN